MSNDTVEIKIDGQPIKAQKGQMIIEVTDKAGINIPRFCYHEKLSVAANCRMCLVEVEKAPKPMPACATPVVDGMNIFTHSPNATSAQKATMEFLLIYHPLDCPICDQGGECELQDIAMGYGKDISRYNERKRVVKDKDLGPLVSTDMTRCIHCTRCVRFGQEIQGIQELGTMGRGEQMNISTYIEKSVDHELSANIIDLCPVGALNNKPYRYSARSWEMQQIPTIAAHDCVGSNMYAHVVNGVIKRLVPRKNEQINESWLSDRDRFSYEGIYSSDRLMQPRLKEQNKWREIEWEEALGKLAESIQATQSDKLGLLASPTATIEEGYLLTQLADQLGTSNIDHRIRQQDFSLQDEEPVFPYLGCEIADLEAFETILVVGSNIRKEAPIIAHRLRKAALKGCKICFVNRSRYDYLFDIHQYLSDIGLIEQLTGIMLAAEHIHDSIVPASIGSVGKRHAVNDEHVNVANQLQNSGRSLILLGNIASRHPAFSVVRALASNIANITNSELGFLSEGPNSAGACIAGVLPHRKISGEPKRPAGLHAADIIGGSTETVIMFGIEPDKDLAQREQPLTKLASKKFVAALTPYTTKALDECTDLQLPIGTFAETAGTFVNCEGRWQSFPGAAKPVGEARPGWKVLRVLGNILELNGFNYLDVKDVYEELCERVGEVEANNTDNTQKSLVKPYDVSITEEEIDIPIYQIDSVVRRATSLQSTLEAKRG